MKKAVLLSTAVCMFISSFASAELVRGIEIDFVTIGNPGNANDTIPTPYTDDRGAVDYVYRIGKYEITNAQWNMFVAAAGAPAGDKVSGPVPPVVASERIFPYNESSFYTGDQQPVNRISWHEAAQFCNYLTTGDKSKGVYGYTGDNTNPGSLSSINREDAKALYGTIYFLPTADEWYKAAYYSGDGYSLYSNGLDTFPQADNGWNYGGGSYTEPWEVGIGAEEQNGTYNMLGNVWEWTETQDSHGYSIFGGSFDSSSVSQLQAPCGYWGYSGTEATTFGFRIATIPEPATLSLLAFGGLALLRKRK